MVPQSLHYLFDVADHYALTVSTVLVLIWVLAFGCYIEEKVFGDRRRTRFSRISGEPRRRPVKVERIGPYLVAKTQARL
jgi:hypothetical protein